MLDKVKIHSHLITEKVIQLSLWQKATDLILKEKEQLLHFLPYYNQFELEKITSLYEELKNLDHWLVIGMGGAILNCKIFANFLMNDNITFIEHLSIDSLQKLLAKFGHNNIGCFFISNSGNTLEVVAMADVILDCNISTKNIVFSYSNEDSLLARMHRRKGGHFIPYDSIMGGRFSTFTRTTQFIRKICHVKDEKLYLGANKILEYFLAKQLSIAEYFSGMTIINCSYSLELQSLVYWFTSSLAESLGRNKIEILPITLQMPLDQHGLLQALLTSKRPQVFNIFKLTKENNLLDQTQLILENTLLIELEKASIPYRVIEITRGDLEALGEILIYLMLEIIITAVDFNLEPFTQPNIDIIKKEAAKNWIKNYD